MLIATGPLYVSWNYTYACNFNCSHCYSRAEWYPKELTTSQYEQIVDQFKEAKVFKVGLGGGEPLLRKDCLHIIKRMSEAGIHTNITTNGWIVDEAMAEKIAQAGLSCLYVSLDSPDADTHDTFRRKPGSHERVMSCLRNAVNAGIQVRLSTVITQVNYEDLNRFVAIAEELNLYGVEFKRFRPAGNGALTHRKYEVVAAEAELRERVAHLARTSRVRVELVYGAEADGGVDSGCPCGTKSICVRPNGDVSPCAYGEAVIGNLMQESLSHLWRHSPYLHMLRASGSCEALRINPNPSNPVITLAEGRA